ncbi:MAG TPA: hypothetical protein VJT67_01905 [Longimicrobiaceae bacterium]|nr:hypothetical protein [Longimicrobiaceae bacterium]
MASALAFLAGLALAACSDGHEIVAPDPASVGVPAGGPRATMTRAQWDNMSGAQQVAVLLAQAKSEVGANGGECKAWIQKMTARATSNVVQIPPSTEGGVGYQWVLDATKYPYVRLAASQAIRAVQPGMFVQMQRYTRDAKGHVISDRAPHTWIVEEVTTGPDPGMWVYDSNWVKHYIVGRHFVTFKAFDADVARYTIYTATKAVVRAPAPAINSLSPTVLVGSDQDQMIKVLGSNIRPNASAALYVNGNRYVLSGSQVQVVSSGEARLLVRTGKTAAAWEVEILNADGTSSNRVGFRVVAPPVARPPEISLVSPNPVVGSDRDQVVWVYGLNFQNGARVALYTNGNRYVLSGAQVQWYSATQLRLLVTTGRAASVWQAEVLNPDGQTSPRYTFRVVPPPPVRPALYSVTPNPVPAIRGEQTITLSGSDFEPGAALIFHVNGNTYRVSGSPVSVDGSGRIRARVTLGTTPAWWSVSVQNPSGLESAQVWFQVR